MDISEKIHMQTGNVFFDHNLDQAGRWMQKALNRIRSPVYITLDLDVLDPANFPSTGTPEPGGLSWRTLTVFLKEVFSTCQVMGFDIVEHAPLPGFTPPDFLAAKLYYKMLSYKFSFQICSMLPFMECIHADTNNSIWGCNIALLGASHSVC